jgi:hypothetical protein
LVGHHSAVLTKLLIITSQFQSRPPLSGPPTRGHLAIASAIIVAGVLISATLLVTVEGVVKTSTITETLVSTTTETDTCSVVKGISVGAPAPPTALVYTNATIGIQDLWNATITGYSGSTQVFSHCYWGINVSEIYDNGPGRGSPSLTLVKVTAQKMEADSDNLTLRVFFQPGGLQNSTDAPFGFVSISASPNF